MDKFDLITRNFLREKRAADFLAEDKEAGGHRPGSYMSRQNLAHMLNQILSICEEMGEGEELEDWVEDKIAHAHAALSDVARYLEHGDHQHEGHEHEDEEPIFKLAEDDLFASEDDERMAYRSWTKAEWKKHLEKYPEMAYYQGAYNKGKFNPARVNKNIKEFGLEKDMMAGRFKPKKKKAGWR